MMRKYHVRFGGRLTEKCLSMMKVTRRLPILRVWKKTINKAGFTLSEVQYNPCINVAIGAYILSQNISENNEVV
jgi:hypothetical protein